MKKMAVFNKAVWTAILFFVSQTYGTEEAKVVDKVNDEGPADFFNMGTMKGVPSKVKAKALIVFDDPKATFAYRRRRGSATDTHACDRITAVPRHLTFITRYNHYRKYTHAYGIPVISSAAPSNAALKRACYVLRFLLADRPILRKYLYTYFGRIGVIGAREGVISIPEHRHLGAWWNGRARGLGGTLAIPISTGGEENLLCWTQDRYRVEDIFLHEFSHGIQEIAVKGGGIPGFMRRLNAAYAYARRSGLWRSTYAMSTVQEYFGEGTQSFFDCNAYSNPPNGIHNHVNTRAKLRSYDPTLFRLVKEVFPCMNKYHKRCTKGTPGSFRMNCDGSRPPKPATQPPKPATRPPKPPTRPPKPPTQPPEPVTKVIPLTPPVPKKTTPKPTPKTRGCKKDQNENCLTWVTNGMCDGKFSNYMRKNCENSCCCTNQKSNCVYLTGQGYCAFRKPFMHRFCRKSCGACI